jgi:hypothetical protein
MAAACSDGGVTPTSPQPTPSISADVVAAGSSDDLCGGLSPCDGYDYGHAGGIGNPGTFFLPELVDNHKPFPGTFLAGLESFLSVAICEVTGSPYPDPTTADCMIPAGRQPAAFSQEDDFYKTQWSMPSQNSPGGKANEGKTFRVHVLLGGEILLAFRDVRLTDPNVINPADGPTRDIRNGSNVNIKVAITDASGIQVGTCSATDSDSGTVDEDGEEALCLIPAGTPGQINLATGSGPVGVSIGAQDFSLLIDVDAQCDGDIETDLPLYGPCVEMAANQPAGEELVDSYVFFCENGRPIGAPSGAFVLQQSDDLGGGTGGTLTLPAVDCPAAVAASELDGFWDLIAGGVEKVAGLLGTRDLIATAAVGHSGGGGSFSKFGSKFQLGGPAYLGPAEGLGGAELPTVVQQDEKVEVVVPVYGGVPGGVPGTTVYFYSTQGTDPAVGEIACPPGVQPYADGAVCDDSGDPVIYTTGSVSEARAVWTPGPASSPLLGGTTVDLRMLCAGCAVEGSDTPSSGGSIDGLLQDAADRDRNPFGNTGYHNGPIFGVVDVFEPENHFTGNAVAHNDLAMVRSALVCGGNVAPDDVTDGAREAAWDCAETVVPFIANLSKGNPKEPNAEVLALASGGQAYFAIEIRNTTELPDLFIDFSQTGTNGVANAEDDLLLVRADGTAVDMHKGDDCAANSGKSLCGLADNGLLGGIVASMGNDGQTTFIEIKHGACGDPGEDFCLANGDVWAYWTLTGGKGGGKGSTIFKDFREWTKVLTGP